MKRQDAIPLGDLISELTKRLGIEKQMKSVRVYQAWDEVVGNRAARCTVKKFYRDKDKILFCTMNSSILANQMYFQSQLIQKRINEVLGEPLVDKVVLR